MFVLYSLLFLQSCYAMIFLSSGFKSFGRKSESQNDVFQIVWNNFKCLNFLCQALISYFNLSLTKFLLNHWISDLQNTTDQNCFIVLRKSKINRLILKTFHTVGSLDVEFEIIKTGFFSWSVFMLEQSKKILDDCMTMRKPNFFLFVFFCGEGVVATKGWNKDKSCLRGRKAFSSFFFFMALTKITRKLLTRKVDKMVLFFLVNRKTFTQTR